MAMTPEQEQQLEIIEERLKAKGATLTPAQKAILMKSPGMMELMGKKPPSNMMPKPKMQQTGKGMKDMNPDKEAGPAKDLPDFPQRLAEDSATRAQALQEMEEEKRRREGVRKLQESMDEREAMDR